MFAIQFVAWRNFAKKVICFQGFQAKRFCKRLTKIRNEQNTLANSTGDSALFLAIGFLEWCEAPTPSQSRRASLFAPLILVHVNLDQRQTEGGGEREFSASNGCRRSRKEIHVSRKISVRKSGLTCQILILMRIKLRTITFLASGVRCEIKEGLENPSNYRSRFL